MAKPIEPTPTLEGDDALRFLKEKERIESLKLTDPEAIKRHRFFEGCKTAYKEWKKGKGGQVSEF